MADDFSFVDCINNFPPFIPRTKIQDYFPWLSQKHMANLECKGTGPSYVKNGRAVVYPTKALLVWLDERSSRSARIGGNDSDARVSSNSSQVKEKEKVAYQTNRRGRKTKYQEVRERRGLKA